MNRLNKIFTLASLSVLLVTVERFSITTKILLQPYNYLRLHEMFQMVFVILITVLVPFFLIKEVSNNFEKVKKGTGFLLFLIFITGIYFYSTGNGVHETAGFYFNQYCDTRNFLGNLCTGLFINDYYTGNIFYFLGAAMMIIPTLLFEKDSKVKAFDKKEFRILVVNAVIYAFAIFAYAAFDRVLVGLIYSGIMTLISFYIFWGIREKYREYPVITYTTICYTLGTAAAVLFRFG